MKAYIVTATLEDGSGMEIDKGFSSYELAEEYVEWANKQNKYYLFQVDEIELEEESIFTDPTSKEQTP